MTTTTPSLSDVRAERNAAILAKRAARLAAATTETRPRCTVAGCYRYEYRVSRCENHWMPLRDLVGTMAGASADLRVSRRAFSEAMNNTAMRVTEWEALADYRYEPDAPEVGDLLDRATDALYAAGYYVGSGARGGRYLNRRTSA